ncbi:hypothetical protein SCHPADRAFT_592506 [Schizopora paradoxa]|uniref:Uncharacterized protein n=1 Tax=Schizopora paradoxa TaxID=27342 RepID=A0A0H2RAI7_9AGAM|nr:hypothetical protein SCHPADRAFT_592506 [Schizopora paradoxa]
MSIPVIRMKSNIHPEAHRGRFDPIVISELCSPKSAMSQTRCIRLQRSELLSEPVSRVADGGRVLFRAVSPSSETKQVTQSHQLLLNHKALRLRRILRGRRRWRSSRIRHRKSVDSTLRRGSPSACAVRRPLSNLEACHRLANELAGHLTTRISIYADYLKASRILLASLLRRGRAFGHRGRLN